MRLSGCTGSGLKERVLVENRDKFVEQLLNGTEDNARLMMAIKLLSYMGTAASDEMFYADDDGEIADYRETFAMIFSAMGQDQHYQMMMAETER